MSITAAELDTAMAAGRLRLGRANRRACRCVGCWIACAAYQARQLWIDGLIRGFLCGGCWSW